MIRRSKARSTKQEKQECYYILRITLPDQMQKIIGTSVIDSNFIFQDKQDAEASLPKWRHDIIKCMHDHGIPIDRHENKVDASIIPLRFMKKSQKYTN